MIAERKYLRGIINVSASSSVNSLGTRKEKEKSIWKTFDRKRVRLTFPHSNSLFTFQMTNENNTHFASCLSEENKNSERQSNVMSRSCSTLCTKFQYFLVNNEYRPFVCCLFVFVFSTSENVLYHRMDLRRGQHSNGSFSSAQYFPNDSSHSYDLEVTSSNAEAADVICFCFSFVFCLHTHTPILILQVTRDGRWTHSVSEFSCYHRNAINYQSN